MTVSNQLSFNKVRSVISDIQDSILILSHRNPDGDAIGSTCALYNYLKMLGKKSAILVPDRPPKFLKWVPGASDILVFENNQKQAQEIIAGAKIIFALDFNELSRVREFEDLVAKSQAYKILIDHHPNPGSFADFSYTDVSVSSTCELIYTFIKELNISSVLDKDTATALYTGIMTDTGCFSFNSSQKTTFEIVADLLHYGIDKDFIYDRVYNNFNVERMRLMGYCLNKKMVYLPKYRTAYISLKAEELREFNFSKGDSEGFVNLPLSIDGVCFSAIFIEHKDLIKASFRSKGNFRTNVFASNHFNGGGHMNASGGEYRKTMDDTLKDFENLLSQYQDELLKA